MLSRSNFSIRQLIPRRRHHSDDDNISLFWDNDEKASLQFTAGRESPSSNPSPTPSPIPSPKFNDKRRNSRSNWLQSSKSSTKKIPQPIIIVRSSEDLHRITPSQLPPLPDTPHSSKSSLCSCEHHAASGGFVSSPRRLPHGRRSPGLSPGHSSIRTKDDDERGQRRLSAPPGSPLENPRPSPRLPITPRKESVKSLPSPTKLTFDLLEALGIQPDNERMTEPRRISVPTTPTTTPRRKSTPTREEEVDNSNCENVQQLIRETDEAFNKSGGKDITTDGKLDFEQTQALAPVIPPTTTFKPASLKPSNKRAIPPLKSPLKAPARTASVSKVRRQKSQKSQKSRQRKARPAAKFKWTVSARDLLNVRLFNRLEVDEVLSPTRLQEIRMSRCSSLVPRPSTETLRTEDNDTPIDPFSLQDLPTRIGAAGVRLSIPTPIEEVSTPRSFDFDLAQDSVSVSPRQEADPSPETEDDKPDTPDTTMAIGDIPFPNPPAKNPARFNTSPWRDLPHLPSIPEVMITAPSGEKPAILSPTSTRKSRKKRDTDTYIFLPATPYTLTAPIYRHGPIRVAKADIALAYSSSQLAAAELDRSLDWTAFQISILGGAGDFYSESRDYSRREEGEDKTVDEICDWWGEYGFEGYGSIQRRSTPPTSPRSSRSPISRGTSPSSKAPIPLGTEHPSGFWNPEMSESGFGSVLLTSRFNTARSLGLRRWTVEGHPKHPAKFGGMNLEVGKGGRERRPSVDSLASLPQSPMLDLVMSQDVRGEEYVVPMGYNLGHDLGDFLAWEAQNVWADGFGVEREVELPA